jgi:hypothetical protein
MQVVMEFNLPEDKFEHRAAQVGTELSCALQEIDQRLRSLAKHEDEISINIETMRAMLREETQDFAPWLFE